MGKPRIKSRGGDQPASLWLARKDEFQRIHEKGDNARKKYRNWLALRLGHMIPGGRGPNRDQLDVHVAFRIYAYYAAVAYDEFVENIMPRRGAGDALNASFVENAVTQMLDMADASETWRAILADIMTDGAGVAWWGLPRYPNPVDVAMMNWGVNDAFAALAPDPETGQPAPGYEPVPGMDHEFLSQELRAKASDPTMVGQPASIREILYEHAAKHARMLDQQDKTPVDWGRERGEFWVERSIVGRGTVWDTSISDLRFAGWMGRLHLIDMDELEGIESFDPAAVALVRPKPLDAKEHGEITSEAVDMTDDRIERENGVARVWEFFDYRQETTHWVPENSTAGGKPFYLEMDESYPYQDLATGAPAVRGFFPCTVVAPSKCNLAGLERTFGIPLLALAEPHIRQIIRLESEVLAQSKRNVRAYGFVGGGWTEATKKPVTSGVDGSSWDIPSSLWDKPGETGIRTLVHPPVSGDLWRSLDRAWMSLARGVGIPYPALVGESMEDTLGQAEMASQSGNLQTTDFVGQLQRAWAHMAEGARSILKIGYSADKVKEMLGDVAAARFVEWQQSDVMSDKLRARFSRSQEDLRRTEQLMKALNIAIDPNLEMKGVRLDVMPLVNELWKVFDLGEPQIRPMTFEEKTQLLLEKAQAGAPGANGSGGPTAKADAPKPSGPNESTQEPSPSAMAGAQSRVLTAPS